MGSPFVYVSIILSFTIAVLTFLYIRQKRSVAHLRKVQDIEAYQAECELKAQSALDACERSQSQIKEFSDQVTIQKTRVAQYQQLLGKFRTAEELHQRIARDTEQVKRLKVAIGKLEHAISLNDLIQRHEATIREQTNQLEEHALAIGTARTAAEIAAKVTYFENYLAQLKADVEAVEETKSLQEFGFYRPRYNFDSSELYERRLEQIRSKQKTMLSEKAACTCETEWTVDGSKSEGTKMVNQQIKLMLRAFNGECDAAVAKVKYNNVTSLEKRIQRSFEQISNLGEAKRIHLAPKYCELKHEELHLLYECQQKKQEEKETQRLIREQMREEQKVAKEIEKACDAADREQAIKAQALEQARAELASTSGLQTAKLESLVSRLENELRAAIEKKAKAIARAQLTKSGHVYILSNIGTLGEGVYKIGMSRRLEPLDRVDELGGASVPFPFDVHAMIYSENAPELETALHRHFSNRRVNLVNLRREFFRVSLDEIRAAVSQHFGQVTFVLEPEAEQFRRTAVMLRETMGEQLKLQIA
jgi:hypothetical protein